MPQQGQNVVQATQSYQHTAGTGGRKVSVPLIIGIVFIPCIFAWFLLQEGYSKAARIVGFGWLAVLVAVIFAAQLSPNGSATAHGSGINVDPHRSEKHGAVALAKQIVPFALKDPSSADFGDVWGMSATVACGFVNAKNSFGAMAGQTRFIFEDGKVSFENGSANFARHWNAACVDRPRAAAPTGAAGIHWGAHPPANLHQFAPPTDEGLAVYVPKGSPGPLEGLPVAESDFSFDHGRLFSADFDLDGQENRDAIITAYVKKYGTPQAYDEDAGTYSWKWPGNHVTVNINYNAEHRRTTVNFAHN